MKRCWFYAFTQWLISNHVQSHAYVYTIVCTVTTTFSSLHPYHIPHHPAMLFSAAVPLTSLATYTSSSSSSNNHNAHVDVWILLNNIRQMILHRSEWSVTISILGLVWMLFTHCKEMSTATLFSNWYIVLIVSTYMARSGNNKIEL